MFERENMLYTYAEVEEIKKELADIYEERFTEMESFYRATLREMPLHTESSPATQRSFSDISQVLADKILTPRKWFIGGFGVLVLIGLGVGLMNHVDNAGIQASLQENITIDVSDIKWPEK